MSLWNSDLERIAAKVRAQEAKTAAEQPTRNRKVRVVKRKTKHEIPRKTPISIGIDFGTTATKVAFRTDGDRVRLVPLTTDETGDARFLRDTPRWPESGDISLKMALYGNDSTEDQDQWEMTQRAVRFIEGVLLDSVEFIIETTGKTKDEVSWSITIGVPVEVRKTRKEALFASIAAQASETAGLIEVGVHAIPEIQAGLVSFTASNEIAPGYYAAFDIGGGTVDASMFAVNKREGGLELEFLSGSVKTTGAEELTRSLREVLSSFDPARTYDPKERAIRIDEKRLESIAEKVHMQTAKVLASVPAKSMYRRYGKQTVLHTFMIGGGAQIRWYPEEIKHTHPKHHLGRAGVPRIELRDVPYPPGFELDPGIRQKHRFFIAYGLSYYPQGTRVAVVGFPSQYSDEEFKPVYQDYKEKLYQHAMEGYGETL